MVLYSAVCDYILLAPPLRSLMNSYSSQQCICKKIVFGRRAVLSASLSVHPLHLAAFNTIAAALWASSSPLFSSLVFPFFIIAFYLIGSASRILMHTEISSVLLVCL